MYFNTHSGSIGHTALLESRILYPKRTQQCLQFFYKMNGSPQDKLVIWIRTDDGSGNIRKVKKIHTIKGDEDQNWKIAHVTLNANQKFRYVFQGIQGDNTTSSGGILLDDISLTETPCPNAVWVVRNFTEILRSTTKGDFIYSPRFYSPEGYGYGVSLYPHGSQNSTHKGYANIRFHMCSGENDVVLEWPALNRQVTITVLDQDPDIKLRMSLSRSFTTLSSHVIKSMNNISQWERPSVVGKFDPSCKCHRSLDYGWSRFISHSQLKRSFLKNDDLTLFVDFEDISHLNKTEVPIKISELQSQTFPMEWNRIAVQNRGNAKDHFIQNINNPCSPSPCMNGGVCVIEEGQANCRCSSSQAFFYTGEQCESKQIHGNVLGILIGGGAGTVVLALAVLAILSK
ncbi:hypothetical protein GDO86_006169 [Hymenochirus boettgeri]|uniref:Meprin A subunit alpha n=1 Tax=Hymenochirus boettgeri TaxID=247094 RepID=A0A8T2JA11_9PIPI|nr:hypothetical protein GDO86_006169 [Hymenochirus boettgeri]